MKLRDIWILGLHAFMLAIWFLDSKSMDYYRSKLRRRKLFKLNLGDFEDRRVSSEPDVGFQPKLNTKWNSSRANHPAGRGLQYYGGKPNHARRRPRKRTSIFSEFDTRDIMKYWSKQYRKDIE